ncbi:peptidase S28 [Myriangium duriaei CBS 260.36]|uniref:Peptidase S28 n=1 Tax=Myriangium duriaei CBS 260.36 TaxID=1168546 RepID=A0A9P4IVZ2_9PEZI|nr:peptidase S28 [Myriangium duriaei CBS 260.36]
MLVSLQVVATATLVASSGLPFVAPRFPMLGGMNRAAQIFADNSTDYNPEYIQIPVDHFNSSDDRTYGNRYWVNSQYYKPGGPVFILDAGEQNAQPLAPRYLFETAGPSSVMSMARRFNGLGLLWEHRYYGGVPNGADQNGSYPSPVNAKGFAAEYTYLTTEQALEDVVYLANNFKPEGLEDCFDQLGPDQTPWIFIGGSYPGIRAAHMRVRNPETIFASWASSAPVQATVDYWTYYAQAERSMTRNCSADYTAVTRYVDNILANGTSGEVSDVKFALLTAISSGPGWNNVHTVHRNESDQLQNSDVADLLLMPFSFYQSYGFEGSVLPFCNIMETFNQTMASTTDNNGVAPAIATESGIAATHNITAAWQAFLVAATELGYLNLPPGASSGPSSQWSWNWQFCSEYGYYQVGNPSNPHTIQSQFTSLDYFQSNCNDTFANYTNLPSTPQVDRVNKYGGWNINPSNVMFTNGQYDPWRALSPGSTEVGSPNRQATQYVPKCNVAPDNGTYFGQVYINAVHATDMRARLQETVGDFSKVGFHAPVNSESFFAGVGLFGEALNEWLPCFGK